MERGSFWGGSQPDVWGRTMLFHPGLEPLAVPTLDEGRRAILSLAKKAMEPTSKAASISSISAGLRGGTGLERRRLIYW